jgi:hypothetical protein
VTIIEADNPLPGFYWMRRGRGQRREPVAIWRHKETGELVCAAGFAKAPTNPADVWTYCAANKVASSDAKFAWEHGHWPEEPPPVDGRNLPADPFDALRIELEQDCERAEKLLSDKPTIASGDQKTCDLFVNLQRSISMLIKRADGMHETEKRPHLEAGKAVDDKFRFRATAKVLCDRLRQRYSAFMAFEERRQAAEAEAKRKAEADRVTAERAKLREDDPIAALTSPEPELPLAPEPVKVQAGGGIGRRAGLKDAYVATVTDYALAAQFFVSHPDLKAVIDRLAKHAVKDAKGAIAIPGVAITRERVAA